MADGVQKNNKKKNRNVSPDDRDDVINIIYVFLFYDIYIYVLVV